MACKVYPYDSKTESVDIVCDSMNETNEFRKEIMQHLGKSDVHLLVYRMPNTQMIRINHKTTLEEVHGIVERYISGEDE